MKKPKIKLLRPPPQLEPPLKQCCIKVDPPARNPEWRKDHYGKNHKLCQRNATVVINGKHYCRPHAGQKALEILMEMEDGQR